MANSLLTSLLDTLDQRSLGGIVGALGETMVMSFLGKRIRDEGMTMSGLGSLLQRESATIRSALPTGLSDLLWPRASMGAAASPVVAQAVERERSYFSWLPLLALAV